MSNAVDCLLGSARWPKIPKGRHHSHTAAVALQQPLEYFIAFGTDAASQVLKDEGTKGGWPISPAFGCKRCGANWVPARNCYKHTNQCLDFGRFDYWVPAKLRITTCQFESPWLVSLVTFFKHSLRNLWYIYIHVYIHIYIYYILYMYTFLEYLKASRAPKSLPSSPKNRVVPRVSGRNPRPEQNPWPPLVRTSTAPRRSWSQSSSRVERCRWSSICRCNGWDMMGWGEELRIFSIMILSIFLISGRFGNGGGSCVIRF